MLRARQRIEHVQCAVVAAHEKLAAVEHHAALDRPKRLETPDRQAIVCPKSMDPMVESAHVDQATLAIDHRGDPIARMAL